MPTINNCLCHTFSECYAHGDRDMEKLIDEFQYHLNGSRREYLKDREWEDLVIRRGFDEDKDQEEIFSAMLNTKQFIRLKDKWRLK